MKSIVEYPADLEKMLFPDQADEGNSGKLMAHYELYKKVSHIEGDIVKCGIAAEDAFTRFALLRNLITARANQRITAFEKFDKNIYKTGGEETNEQDFQIKKSINIEGICQTLLKKGLAEKIEFIPGHIGDSIPEYLMENPEMKIAYLNIDFDCYESASTTLEFFYPRIVHGGILILDNYYKKEDDYNAVKDYFKYSSCHMYNFSINKGPHYMVRL